MMRMTHTLENRARKKKMGKDDIVRRSEAKKIKLLCAATALMSDEKYALVDRICAKISVSLVFEANFAQKTNEYVGRMARHLSRT